MARYKVTFVVTEKSVIAVRKIVESLKQTYGVDIGSQVEKIESGPSRADRLTDAEALVDDAKSDVGDLKAELEEWREGLPENLQDGSKAEELDEAIGKLEELADALDGLDFDVEFPSMM